MGEANTGQLPFATTVVHISTPAGFAGTIPAQKRYSTLSNNYTSGVCMKLVGEALLTVSLSLTKHYTDWCHSAWSRRQTATYVQRRLRKNVSAQQQRVSDLVHPERHDILGSLRLVLRMRQLPGSWWVERNAAVLVVVGFVVWII